MNTQFIAKLEEYVHLNYHERMKRNEELFNLAKVAKELQILYNTFYESGVHTYEEKILRKLKDVANSKDEWLFIKNHSYDYPHINNFAINKLKSM